MQDRIAHVSFVVENVVDVVCVPFLLCLPAWDALFIEQIGNALLSLTGYIQGKDLPDDFSLWLSDYKFFPSLKWNPNGGLHVLKSPAAIRRL